jgi:hypothetical protein
LSNLEADPAFEALWTGQRPTEEQIAIAAEYLGRAVSAVPSGASLVRLGEIELTQAQGSEIDTATRSALLTKAEGHLIDGIAKNPGQPSAWVSLAEIRIARGASERDILAPLAQSLSLAPNLRLVWIPRARLLLRYWPFLAIDELPAFARQILTIWSASPADRAQLVEAAIGVDEMGVVAAIVGEPPANSEQLRALQARTLLRLGKPAN